MRRLMILVTALIVLWSSGAAAKTISLAVVTKPGSAQNLLAEKFAELLAGASGGRWQVKIFHSGAMGNESQILDKVRTGKLLACVVTAGPHDRLAPEVAALEYPFLFASYAQVDRALAGPAGRQILVSLQKAGLMALAFGENGFRHLTNNRRPVRRAADLAGLKIRVMESAAQQALWQRLGAVVVAHAWPIDGLLKSGRIDGQENPLSVIWGYRLDRLQRHLSLTGHVYSAHICSMNLQWFKALTADDQAMMAKAMRQAAAWQRADSRKRQAGCLLKLKSAGMAVVADPDLASFKAKLAGLDRLPLYQQPRVKGMLDMLRRAAGRN